MLKMRPEQVEVFLAEKTKKFEERMLAHLIKCFPRQSEALGKPKIIETVHLGIERAAGYGIVAERDVCKYVDLMIVFGCDFDSDPKLPWASITLRNPKLQDPGQKVTSLQKAASDFVRFGGLTNVERSS